MQMGNVSVEYLILLWKELFLEMRVPFRRISSVQDKRDIVKWNDLYSFGKSLVYL